MIETLATLLRIAGAGLILLAVMHVPIGRHLQWREESARLSLVNRSVFQVHTLFICLMLVIMGLPCLLAPSVFLVRSEAGCWFSWSFTVFWVIRLLVQWLVFPWSLWVGKTRETLLHWFFTMVWIYLAALFTLCSLRQSGWLE